MIKINSIRSELFHELHLDGQLATDDDVATLRDGILPLLEGGERHLVLHLDGIRFVSSLGLRFFAHLQQMCESQGGGMCLLVRDARLREIIEFAGLSRQIAIYASEDELGTAAMTASESASDGKSWPGRPRAGLA